MFSREAIAILFFIFAPSVVRPGVVSPDETKLVFYYGPEFTDSISFHLFEAMKVLEHPMFNKNETHCYLHGYHENQDSESIHVIFDAYMKRKTINLLTIDWAVAASENYLQAAFNNIEALAPALADMILKLYNAGLKRESFSVVAHSLGAQLAGMTGRQIIKTTKDSIKIYRMTVLDAAFPLFFNRFPLQTVSQNDAEFLQAIHTDIGTYGTPKPVGTVDFWPNGGLQGQPGCPQGLIIPFSKEDLCSHQRSWRFWAESVANIEEPRFWAFPSSNYIQFLIDGPRNSKDCAIQMGLDCPMDARGNYYLRTNSESPFAMGLNGY